MTSNTAFQLPDLVSHNVIYSNRHYDVAVIDLFEFLFLHFKTVSKTPEHVLLSENIIMNLY